MLSAVVATPGALAGDWPSWRGPEQSGAARERAAITSWSQEGENLLWNVPVGGRTTPVVLNGRLYTIAPVGDGERLGERVICLDADTGRTLWEHRFGVYHTDIVENRVGWTAPVGDPETGNIYAHGTGGDFFCFDRDGRIVWKASLTEEFGRISGYGGRLHTPIIDEDRVVISFLNASWGNQARGGHRYAAFDKRTGQVVWWAEPGGPPLDTTYACPVVAVIDGKRMLVAPNADGNVYGMLARTGQRVWSFKLSKAGLNSSPVVGGNYAYVSHSEENLDSTEMGRVVCIDAARSGDITGTGEVWRFDGCKAGYASPALANGRLYVVDNSANLFCLDAQRGRLLWEYKIGRVGKGSPVVTADGVIYVGEVNGTFHILKDAGDRCESLDVERFTWPDRSVVEIFGSPAVVGGRVFFMTRYHTCCLGSNELIAIPVPAPPAPAEGPADEGRPGHLLVVPAEVTLRPGEAVSFSARLFDVGGRPLGPVKPEWSAAVPGATFDPTGATLSASRINAFSAGAVTAKVSELTATARVRISPNPPIREDFESTPAGGAPPGWVGVAGKTKVVECDGGKVLQKLADNPSAPFMRVRGYSGPAIPAAYTVQADLLGTPRGDRYRPDMGLMNSRYKLILLGNAQSLRLVSWSSVPRIQKDVPFEWNTDVWFRMKLRVDLRDDESLIRGKVWPREEPEPEAWSIELTDPYPNREGSPGIYGYSPGTTDQAKGPEIFYDNYVVIPNE